jgi:hypothetical protein
LFVAERRSIDARWLAPAAVGGLFVLMLSIAAFALAGNNRSSSPPAQQAAPPTVVALDLDEDHVESEAPTPLPTLRPVIINPPSPTEDARQEFVRIFNTGGTGAFIRREARDNAPGIVAYRDGTILRIVGSDTTVDGRLWRNVEDRQGNRGWTRRDYLEASPTGF